MLDLSDERAGVTNGNCSVRYAVIAKIAKAITRRFIKAPILTAVVLQ
jgi:hypothetical protein